MSSNLADLHPLFQPIARAILAESEDVLGHGLIRPAVTFRSVADQVLAKNAGLSQVNLGWHQFGLAMDVAVITPEGAYVKDGEDGRYRTFGEIAVKHGCVWGGNWAHPDWDHCEWHPGFSLTMYLAWLDTHKVATA